MQQLANLKSAEFLKSLQAFQLIIKQRNLDLYNNQLQDKGIAVVGLSLSKFPALQQISLNVAMNQIQEGLFMILGTILSTSRGLDTLNLDMSLNQLEKEPSSDKLEFPLRNLAKKSSLTKLFINLQQVTGLSEDFISLLSAIIGQLTQLKTLTLTFNKTQSLIPELSLKPIELIALSNFFFKKMNYVYQDFTDLTQLQTLILNCQKCKVHDQEMDILAIQLPRLVRLQKFTLNLSENDLRKVLPRLSAKIAYLQELVYLKLDVSKNPYLDHDSCYLFIENLSNSNLECLDLQMRETNLVDDDLIEAAKVLRKMEKLFVLNLDLKQNSLKERGAKLLGQCLASMKDLKAVTLDLGLRASNIIYDSTPQYRDLMNRLVFYRFL